MSTPTDTMHFAAALSHEATAMTAAQEVVQEVLEDLGPRKIHVAFLFVSSLYDTDWTQVLSYLRAALGEPVLLGCTGGGIIGQHEELECASAMSLVAAHLPDVHIHPFRVSQDDIEHTAEHAFWISHIGMHPEDNPIGIVLPDPFTCDPTMLLESLSAAYPRMPLIGGLASSTQQDEHTAIFLDHEVISGGAVGVLLGGNISVQTIVSQGCRPIGRPYIITKSDGNVILELASESAVEQMQQLYQSLSSADQSLARHALFLGIVMDEHQAEFDRGDFLIRNLVGMDPDSGALAVGDHVSTGQTVQFQLRDAETSSEDLDTLLQAHSNAAPSTPAAGALLFNCLGRGQDLYGKPNYDIQAIQSTIGPVPLAGFFCNGEIGPVSGRNFIHGFTSSLGLFRPRTD